MILIFLFVFSLRIEASFVILRDSEKLESYFLFKTI